MVTNKLPLQKEDRIFFCVIVEEWRHNEWVLDKVYTHAPNATMAYANYKASTPIKHRIVAIAPVIGLKADENGENITV